MNVDLRLYALVDPEHAGGHSLPDLARRVAEGGATLVQLRDKCSETREMVASARAIKAVLKPLNVPFIINDRVDVALAAEADGVHVGQDDMDPADARRLLGKGGEQLLHEIVTGEAQDLRARLERRGPPPERTRRLPRDFMRERVHQIFPAPGV